MAQFNEEDRQWLYKVMQQNKVDTGTYEEFKQQLDNNEDRQWYYDKSQELGLKVGSKQEFDDMMWERPEQDAPQQVNGDSANAVQVEQPGQQLLDQVQQPNNAWRDEMVETGINRKTGEMLKEKKGNIYDNLYKVFGDAMTTAKPGDQSAYAQARSAAEQMGVGDMNTLMRLVGRVNVDYAREQAKKAVSDIIAKLPERSANPMADLQAVYYDKDIQKQLHNVANTMGNDYEDIVNKFVKPQLAQAMKMKYGGDDNEWIGVKGLHSNWADVNDRWEREHVGNLLGDIYDTTVKEALDAGETKRQNVLAGSMPNFGMFSGTGAEGAKLGALMNANRQANETADPAAILQSLIDNMSGAATTILQDEKTFEDIWQRASAKNMDVNDYIEKYVVPQMQQTLADRFEKEAVSREMPKSTTEYIMNGLTRDNVAAMLVNKLVRTEAQNRYASMADMLTEEGKNPDVDPGLLAEGARLAAGMAADFWLWGGWGKIGGKAAEALLSRRLTELAASRGLTEAAAREVMMQEAKHSLKGRALQQVMQHIPQSVVMGTGASTTTGVARGFRDNEDLGTIITNAIKELPGHVLTFGAFGTANALTNSMAANWKGWKKLLGKALGYEGSALTLYGTGEMSKAMNGQDAFEQIPEGLLKAHIDQLAMHFASNPGKAVGDLFKAVRHPVKWVGTSDAENTKGVLTEEDVADLMESSDGRALWEVLSDMKPKTSTEAVKNNTAPGAHGTEETAARLAEWMNNKDRPADRKRRVGSLLGFVVPKQLETSSDMTTAEDGTVTLRTRDKDGNCVQELHFDTWDEADKWQQEHQQQLEMNDMRELWNGTNKERRLAAVLKMMTEMGLEKPADIQAIFDGKGDAEQTAALYNALKEVAVRDDEPNAPRFYEEGRKLSLEEQHDASVKEQRVFKLIEGQGEEFANDVLAGRDNPDVALPQIREKYGDVKARMATIYYNNYARTKGVMDEINTEVDNAVKAANERVYQNAHPSGNVIAVTADNKPAYLTDGDITINADGTINTNGHDTIIVRDAETGEVKMTDPANLEVTGVYSESDLIRQNEEVFRQQLEKKALDNVKYAPGTPEQAILGDIYIAEDGMRYMVGWDENTGKLIKIALDESGQPIEGDVQPLDLEEYRTAKSAEIDTQTYPDSQFDTSDIEPMESASSERIPLVENEEEEKPSGYRIPTNDKGQPEFVKAQPEQTRQYFVDKYGEEKADSMFARLAENTAKAYDKLVEKGYPDTTDPNELMAYEDELAEAKKQADYWQSLTKKKEEKPAETPTAEVKAEQPKVEEKPEQTNQQIIDKYGINPKPAEVKVEQPKVEKPAEAPAKPKVEQPKKAEKKPEPEQLKKPTAEEKIADGSVRANIGRAFNIDNADGSRLEIKIDRATSDGKTEVTQQLYDAKGNPVGEPEKKVYNTLDVGNGIISKRMKPVLDTEGKLREAFKGKIAIQNMIDVLSEEEQKRMLDVYEKGDNDAYSDLMSEFRENHKEDLILRERDNRNSEVDKILNGPGSREQKLRQIRKQYQGYDDAEIQLSDETMQPTTLEEYVSDLHSRVPKQGEGVIAYSSYETPDGHKVIGLQDETGFGKKSGDDTKGFAPWLAKQGTGMSLQQYAENIHSQLPEAVQQQYDVQDVRNAIRDVFGAAERPSDIPLMIVRRGVLQAEQAARRMEEQWIDAPSYQKVSPDDKSFAGRLARAKQTTNTEPSEAQKEAGNYKKGHVSFGGYDFVVENPEGSMRRGKDADGHEWEQKMNNTYGYILGKYGKDGDHLDMFLNDAQDLDNWNGKVYVVDQVDPKTGQFDEHKVMYGFNSEDEARDAYLSNYEEGWKGIGKITGVSKDAFDKWLDSSKRKLIEFADHSITKEALEKEAKQAPTEAEIDIAMRDELIDEAKTAGVDISTNYEADQALLDRVNGVDENLKQQTTEVPIDYHKVDDAEELKQLENQPTVKRYRAMQLIDGKLYPPMSAKVDGEMRQPTEIGVWEKAEERPDLVKNGKFVLNKAQKGQGNVPAAYNPYFHTSTSGLNDQFTSAYKRPELVVVEVEIPESELTSGYKAEGAKDAVGDVAWHSGVVNGQLPADRQRQVTLSRYSKVKRIVPDSEVAEMIAKQLEGINVEVPYNVVTPSLRAELEKQGVKISDKPAGSVTEDANGNRIRQQKAYHGSGAEFDAFDHSHMGEGEGYQTFGYGTYVTEVPNIAKGYAEKGAAKKYNRLNPGYGGKEIFYKGEKIDLQTINPLKMAYDMINNMGTVKKAIEKCDKFVDIAEDPEMKQMWRDTIDILKNSKKSDFKARMADLEGQRYVYDVEIPDDNGENYLDYELKPTDKQLHNILSKFHMDDFVKEQRVANMIRNANNIGNIIDILHQYIGGKATAKLLHDAGYVGTKYPTNYMAGGNREGTKNYVIYDENDAKITDTTKFFKTPEGYAYGFTYQGKIHIDPRIATSETPIHEYGHLWAEMKRQSAPEEWEQIKQTLLTDEVVKPFIEKVMRDYPELTGEGKEDSFIEEVLTQYSGKHGAEKLRQTAEEIKKELGDDADAQTIAEAAISRVKQWLNKFWESIADMMGWKYKKAEDIADAVLRDLLNGVNPTEKMKEASAEVKGQNEVERTLMGMHNISEEKLKKAIKLGGLANPSMAVVDTKNGVLDNFGEISLIPKSDLIDRKKGRNVGTWASDAYTPRFPKTYLRISDKNRKALNKWLDSLGVNDEMRYQLGQQFNDYYNSYDIREDALQYAFLHEKGLTDKVDYVRHDDVSPSFLELVDKYGNNIEEMIMRTREDEDFRKEISDKVISFETTNAMKDVRRNEGETAREYMDRRKEYARVIRKLLTDENDIATFSLTDHFLRDNASKMQANGKFDPRETLWRTRDYIRKNGLEEEYAKYFADKSKELGIEEMVANGHDRNGRLKFKPITLEDISKQMKKEGRAGGEGGFGDSPGALRAKLTPMLNSLEEMRKEKGRLVSHEDFEAEKDPYFEKVFHIQNDLFNGDYDDMLKVLRTSDMEATAKRLGYELTPEEVDDLKVFKNLTINLPTEYFETKFERPVMLNEFEIAVVPENTDPEIVKALKDAGVDVRTYSNPSDNPDGGSESRRNTIMEAIQGRDDIRFQMVGEKGAAEADKAEGVNTRLENLQIADSMEKEGKDSRAIKLATGWERGKDGKWRYETVDEKADILDDYNQKIIDYNNKRSEFHKEQGQLLDRYQRMDMKIPKRADSRKYSEEEQAKFREMRKQRDKVWKQYMDSMDQEKEFMKDSKDAYATKLVDLLGENHELFKYYPQLKDLTVSYAKNMQQGVAGSYNDKEGIKIGIDQMHVFGDNNDLNNDNVNGILLHEIQHAIQDIEGFAKGGNLYTATTEAGINAIVQKKQAERDVISTKMDMYRKWLYNPEELKLISQLDRRTVEEEKKHLEEKLDELSYQYDRIGMYIDKIKRDKAPAMSDARDLYSRLAGEVEARNASERINMSEEERRKTTIEKTEDYPREDQVVMMDYPDEGESASMGDGPDTFKDRQERAVREKGVVRPGLMDKSVEVIPIEKHKYTGNIAEATKQAKEAAKKKYAPAQLDKEINKYISVPKVQHYDNFGEKFDYIISSRAIEEGLNPKQQAKSDNKGAHLAMAEHLDEIINKSIEVEEHPDYIKNKDGERDGSKINPDALMHRFYGVVTIDGKPYSVMTLMREDRIPQNKDGLYAYEVQKIKVLNDETLNTLNGEDSTKPESLTYPLAKVLKDVDKSKDPGKNLLIESKKMQKTGETEPNSASMSEETPRFQRVSNPDEELTPEKEQYWKDWEKAMNKWKERNGIPAEVKEAPEKPAWIQGEPIFDFAKRMADWHVQDKIWRTAPKLEDYRQAREDRVISDEAHNAELQGDNLSTRNGKARRVAADLQRIRHAMSRQKAYDKETVKAVTDFAQDFMKMGFGDNLSRGEMERMLSSVKNATGAKSIKSEVDNIMNILLNNHLKNLDQRIQKLSSVKELSKTAQGVEKQGKLELKGQRMIQEYRKARQSGMDAETLREDLYKLAEKMSKNDEEAPMLEQEYEGKSIALQYLETIEASRAEWAELDNDYNDAVKNYKTSGRTYQEQQQLLESLDKAMMENKIERIAMYGDIIGRLEGNVSESVKGAKEFLERKKQRIAHIHQLANADLAGKNMGALRVNSGKQANFFLQPLGTFEQMLKMLGARNPYGEGYLHDYFIRNWMEAIDKSYTGETKAKEELDEKAREVFGNDVKRWSDLYKLTRKMEGMDVELLDGEERKTFNLTPGNLMYIYMANKMNDGKMKLRKMGIDEEKVEAIKDHLDPRLIELADWLQEEYLPSKRTEYNKVHERMFGAPMAAIEHYFPIKILSDARVKEEDVNVPDAETLPSTITGNIIKRRKNTLPLDILNTDALSLAVEHIEDMERWAATAEWNQDVNTLLSYTTFRNKVKNMDTIYGSGDPLWNNFKNAARMAAGTYNPSAKAGGVDKAVSNIAKGVTAAKINFRVYTAFKQILSAPAFLHDVNLGDFVKYAANPLGSWKWAMENMPVFQKRWKSRQAGDTRLMDDPTDWKMWKNNVVQLATRMGMSANGFVDGVTCAVGARAIYETRYKKYLNMGASEEKAHKRALQDAEIGYNLTQQSSEGAFVSAIQKDRTVMANMLSVFRNSSMAYTRQWVDAARNLGHRMQDGYKEDSIDFMTRQLQDQLGLDENQAREAAEAEYNRAGRHEVAKLLNMMFGVTTMWNLGASLPYLLLGDDNKLKKEMLTDAMMKGMFAGATEGMAAGNIFSDFVALATNEKVRKSFKDEGLWSGLKTSLDNMGEHEINPLPLFADIEQTIGKMKYDGFAAAQDVFNLCMQSAVGVNPQTFTDMWNACMDYGMPGWDGQNYSSDPDNWKKPKEIALFIMRLLNAPASSWKNKYIDELGMTVDEAKKLPYEEMARRYAHYKHWKDVPFMGWLRGEEGREAKMEKIQQQFDKAVQERMDRLTDDEINSNLVRSQDIEERRKYAKMIAQRMGISTSVDAEKADEDDWYQKNYQRLMQYNDIKEDEILADKVRNLKKRKLQADEKALSEINKLMDWIRDGKYDSKSGRPSQSKDPSKQHNLMEPGKKNLNAEDPEKNEAIMKNIRKWRKEALELAEKAEKLDSEE